MGMQTLYRVAVAGVLAMLAGCLGTNVRSLPDDTDNLGRKGFAMAEIHIVGGLADYMDVIVDQHTKGYVKDDFYAVALSPGTYTMESLSRINGGSSGGFGGVTVTTTEYLNYPINRQFTIRAGEVTNLGEIVILPDPAHRESKQFNVVNVDNSADAPALLKTHYPKLAGSLRPGALAVAPGNYARGEDLNKLRMYIATVLAEKLNASRYVAGPAGTLARVERDRSGKPAKLQLLDPGMIEGLVGQGEDRAHDRFAYTSNDGRVFVLRAGQIQQRSLPDGVSARSAIFLAGDKNVVIPANRFTLYTSTDDGATWLSYDGAAYKSGEDTPYAEYDFAKDATGFFVYRSYPARVVYSPVGSPSYELVPLPQDVKEIRHLTLLKSDLLIEVRKMAWTAKTPIPFYVRARAGGEWRTHYMPNATCGPLIFLDATGQNLRAVCGQVVDETTDGGEHWTARQ